MLSLIPNKLQVRKSKASMMCKVHKYRRFSKKNKTYDLNKYFCVDCGHSKPINQMFGIVTQCWKCDKSFSWYFVSKLPIFPLCQECDDSLESKRGRRKSIRETKGWIDDEIVNKNENLVDEILDEFGLK